MGKVKTVRGVLGRPRRLGELPTPTAAIVNFCFECKGRDDAKVGACRKRSCWLWPYRARPDVLSVLRLVRAEADKLIGSERRDGR